MKKILSILLLLSFLLSACGEATITPVPTTEAEAGEDLGPVIYTDPSQPVEARVEDLLKRMTLDEKIGQMTQVEKGSIKPGDITKYYIGSILSGGGGSPSSNTVEAWYEMVQGYQEDALKTQLAIPIIYGVDAVHGHGNLLDATIFPHNIGLGATNNPELVERIGRATAEEILATGIHWNFSPVVAVVQDVRPIATSTQRFKDEGLIGDADLAEIERDVAREVNEAVAYAEACTWEPVEDLTRFVYSERRTA